MTTFERFERDIPELMTELAPAQVPDYFDSMLQETARHSQRPAWSYLERWLPMGVYARTAQIRPLNVRPILIFALIGALIAAGLAVYIGSRATQLPPPFGVAGNGELLYRSTDGSFQSIRIQERSGHWRPRRRRSASRSPRAMDNVSPTSRDPTASAGSS
jgi:hypothetical protein